jgi:hypothetical protein
MHDIYIYIYTYTYIYIYIYIYIYGYKCMPLCGVVLKFWQCMNTLEYE